MPLPGASSLHDWTVALLAIRHLDEAKQRITVRRVIAAPADLRDSWGANESAPPRP